MPVLFARVILVLGILGVGMSARADPLTLVILRRAVEQTCTMGELRLGDTFLGYTLERPPIGNINYISSIPTGTYEAVIREDGPLGWRIALRGVPGRDNIQIHVGNGVDNSVGCILVGLTAKVSECRVESSGEALRRMRAALESSVGWRGVGTVLRVTIRCEGSAC